MRTETINGMTKITAKKGYFLANEDMTIYGESILLGTKDKKENYKELPLSEMPTPIEQLKPLTEEEKKQLELLLERQKITR